MTLFWLSAAGLLLAGACFFLPLFLGRMGADAAERRRWNLLIHAQRRKELAADALGAGPDALMSAELDRDLLTDLDASAPAALQPANQGRAALAAGLIAAAVLSISLYLHLGRSDLLDVPPAAADKPAGSPDMAASLQQLAERLAKNPNDLQGWMLLGRSLLATGQPERAATAYEFAIKLAPDDLDLKASYVQALSEANRGSLQGKPAEVVAEILARDAAHPAGLWLAGLEAAERKDMASAIVHWQKLKALLPPDSEDRQALDQYIAKAQGLGRSSPAAEAPQPAKVPAGGASIRVKVTLAEALKGRVAPDDTVFVFARAASGPPMPLAVARKKAKDLPLEVTLDDAMAMMPERKLSSFDHIVIGARVSKTGQPMPASGDLQGLSKPVPSQSTHSQTIEIREIVP